MEDVNAKVASRIRRLREAKGFSQEYISAKLGIPQNTYSRLENGDTKINLDRLFSLSNILEETIYNILDLPAYQQFNECSQQTVNGNVSNHGISNKEENPYIIAIEAKEQVIKSLQAHIITLQQIK
jgi:transcriptional regulator with XRE-family HTH domain